MSRNINKLTRPELLDAAVARVVAKWPDVDAAHEREIMSGWDEFRLATAYAELSDAETEDAAEIYPGAPGYDSADLGGIAGISPLDD